jgi:peroxiredoxin
MTGILDEAGHSAALLVQHLIPTRRVFRMVVRLLVAFLLAPMMPRVDAAVQTNAALRLEQAPPLVAYDIDGVLVDLSKLVAQGPVVLTFWATWCKPCAKELPALATILGRLDEGERATLVSINEDGPRNRAKLRSFWRRYGLHAPIIPDDEGSIAERFHVLAFPTTLVIDNKGRVAATHQGYRPGDEAEVGRELHMLSRTMSSNTDASADTASTP